MDAKDYLLHISRYENRLYEIRTAIAIDLDSAREASGNLKYPKQYQMAEGLFECLREAEQLANQLWRSLRAIQP